MTAGRTVSVGVLDYGSGNLHSACRALAATGADVVLSSDHDTLRRCDKLVVPGVGAFAACMDGLEAIGGDDLVRAWAADERPLLGICVGHQVLFTTGVEHGTSRSGIGLLPGVVEQLHSPRLPHMGWNTVEARPGSVLLRGGADERYYFVHSYGVRSQVEGASWAEHGGDRFVAVVEQGAISSTQFHPEKSGDAGARLLGAWVHG